MTEITLDAAQAIIAGALQHAGDHGLKPLCVVVLDARGTVKAAASQEGTSLKRYEIAHGKAFGALSLGIGSRSINKRANEQAYFVAAVSHVAGGALVPVPGGVLVKNEAGSLIGAVGISGDTSDNDEAAALAGIVAAGLKGDPGAD
ncbi:Uncharacterized conserved protein GlcG, DUF336 family [Faunimonas pinastri]|uniref:Uncharacterized conserved protein GlcG, DUF336 family n=1 Tax=Faunimonas pinastri TaxID=1855383 RepID=A0A1H9JDK9_9HYPH|nr:heme-binding protein [Faunimonas pinastri]SEQ84930.1 Uncharacterized conserved protein GlcG, DUF336 family [Faunimonas pinastri]